MTKNTAGPDARLEMIARGDLAPAEALADLRAALRPDGPGEARVYSAVRDFVWKTLTAREFGNELAEWHDVIRHLVSMTRRKGSATFAERLYALAELISQSGRFAELQPVEEVLQRKHVRKLLVLLGTANDALPRSSLVRRLGLADANLSRILSLLASTGLITRHRLGKEASFTLTETGRQAIADEVGTNRHRAGTVSIEALGVPIATWHSSGKSAGSNLAFRHLLQSLDCPANLSSGSQVECMAHLAARATESHALEHYHLLSYPNDRWLQCRAGKSGEYSTVVLVDVSAERQHHNSLSQKLLAAHGKISELDKELAAAKERETAYIATSRLMREEIVRVTNDSAVALQRYIDSPQASAGASDQLSHDVKPQLDAATSLARELLSFPAPGALMVAEDEYFDLASVVKEIADNFKTLGARDLELRLDNIGRVKTGVPIPVLLTQFLAAGTPKSASSTGLVLQAQIDHHYLIFTLANLGESRWPHSHDRQIFPVAEEPDHWSSWSVVAKGFGADFEVTTPVANGTFAVTLRMPVEVVPAPGSKRRRIGIRETQR